MKENVFIIFVLLFLISTYAYAQNPAVTNVVFKQRTDGSNIVDIYYDLYDAAGRIMTVNVYVSNDGGITYGLQAIQLSGDVGKNITGGNMKHIVWTFGLEYPDYYNDKIVIKIIADNGFKQPGAPCSGVSTVLYEGKTYNAVQIGSQCWLKENLDVGRMIQNSTEQSNNGRIDKFCYNNDPANCLIYGGLYQWSEAMQYSETSGTQGICPNGWHIPTISEYEILLSAVNSSRNDLLAIGQLTGTNITGFTALLSGAAFKLGSESLTFAGIGGTSYFWASGTKGAVLLFTVDSELVKNYTIDNSWGVSVRCIKNETPDFVPCAGLPTVTYAGKTYTTVQIGPQCWLKENLDVGIIVEAGNDQLNNGTIEKYCFNNDSNNCSIYGGLYQWNEAMQYSVLPGTRGICPPGFHIPTKLEFEKLSAAVNNDGNLLKSIGQGSGDGKGSNKSGFSALLSGIRGFNTSFYDLGNSTNFWSSSEESGNSVFSTGLGYNSNAIKYSNIFKPAGLSIRCLKD